MKINLEYAISSKYYINNLQLVKQFNIIFMLKDKKTHNFREF